MFIEAEGRKQWHDLLRSWDVGDSKADQKFDEICCAYDGPDRYYHTLNHDLAVLDTVESLSSHVNNVNAVKLAAWLHDVIYDSKASDNEERSAEYAERTCQELTIPEGQRVAARIRKTKTHEAGDDVDAQVCSMLTLLSLVRAMRSTRHMQRTFGGNTLGCRKMNTEQAGGKSWRSFWPGPAFSIS